ncbi:MAG: hypothetical protein J0M12_02325, partial [Deltaproteobacteria bacterium]|nr:hypothetical protein [Deltaproteobacteria bacterium]
RYDSSEERRKRRNLTAAQSCHCERKICTTIDPAITAARQSPDQDPLIPLAPLNFVTIPLGKEEHVVACDSGMFSNAESRIS